jgi:peptidoglycan L-alanyl-D-glutamate endopeptidase CwlK
MINNSVYRLGSKSLSELSGVHDDLVDVVNLAITLTTQDFAVHDGRRTADEQNALYLSGASKLDGDKKISRHQTGHAVDLVPYVNGKLRWEWPVIFPVADAVRKAAVQLRVPIRWGGVWQVFTDRRYDGMSAEQIYNTNPSWDGAHFELPSTEYPA